MPFADIIIIGSGIAALSAAKQLAKQKNVMIITKSKVEDSNSMLAQGGIAAVIDKDDVWREHYRDTVVAGCYHNDQKAVKKLVKDGTCSVKKLIHEGMLFDRNEQGEFHLGQEGAHNRRRILHAGGDATGKELVQFMFKQLQEQVNIIENEMAIDLIIHDGKCIGLKTINNNDHVKKYYANHVILATGGCGSLYKVSSNNETVVGDGFSMAYRAGAELADLEFMQFHPTMLYTQGGSKGLVSEAVRGEGAFLVNNHGVKIMENVHVQKDLAPRDIVARAIHHERSLGNDVFLNISMISNFKQRFPTITALCEDAGIDITAGLIPVAPGAHFIMGGVKTNLHSETSIPGLYAVGEVACTGVHGANRLASNSLLEGIVFGENLANYILSKKSVTSIQSSTKTEYAHQKIDIELPTRFEIQEMMTSFVGIERDRKGLLYVKNWFEKYLHLGWLSTSLKEGTKEQIKTINMLSNGWLIATSALLRTESRGGHYRTDYPLSKTHWQNKQVVRQKDKELISLVEPLLGVK
ncbi:L-aspartate oxidase [Litchfieldia alkalitelluris]|uniref:L-aspartate oxidase n=1 Tax=Litchfieldia alkalitelluris TaxID=304268 RepID=UPI000998794B|nr:L-aspartate oxidase [Litchfieldia alkalitelluris]